jgi:hypothetical protein
VRHALATVSFGDSGLSERIERLAKAICNGESDPFLYEQAVIIAENQILLGRVRAARIAAIESQSKLTSVERQLLLAGFPSLEPDILLRHINQGEIRKMTKLVKRYTSALGALGRRIATKTAGQADLPRAAPFEPVLGASHLQERPHSPDHTSELIAEAERVIIALPEWSNLERYERRALSRRRRALRRFGMLRDTS